MIGNGVFKAMQGNNKINLKRLHKLTFGQKLFLSYFIILIICILSMGGLSYSYIRSNIMEQSISSNKKLLNQFKNTIDGLVLQNIN
ncbi:MAG: hypothetical protein HPY74_19175 [Firmicutes bacterium]|nr:hypothetical protein [Bacillota bacterium]